MGRKKSWKSGEIKSMQTFMYRSTINNTTQGSITINAVDTSKTIVPSSQSVDNTPTERITGNSRAHYLSNSTTVNTIARNGHLGGTGYPNGARHVVEFY